MAAGRLDLLIEQGSTFEEPLIWKSGGVAVDVTGYTARLTIRDRVGGSVLLALTTENGRIAVGTTDGSIRLTVTDEDTATIGWTHGVYVLEVTSPAGVTRRLLEGKVRVSPR
jgi:hypothetical protein